MMTETPLGNKVTADVDTLYPFSDTLTTTLTAVRAFTYQVRIPSWVSNGTISVNGGAAEAVSPTNGLHSVSVGAGTTKLVLNLPSDITIGKLLCELRHPNSRVVLTRYLQSLAHTTRSPCTADRCIMPTTSLGTPQSSRATLSSLWQLT
jgi:hypothetical protein